MINHVKLYAAMLVLMFMMILGLNSRAMAQIRQPSGNLHFVFINPSSEQDGFWNIFTSFTQAAADDLNVDLEVLYAHRNSVTMLEHIRTVADRNIKPDAIILKALKGMGEEALELANTANIPIFFVNAGVDYAQVGEPQENYPFWIGDRLPLDEKTGYDLAVLLIETALKADIVSAEDGKVHILAFNGTASDTGAMGRARGLQQAVEEYGDQVVLEQITSANWRKDIAAQKFHWLYKRYPDTQVIWSASDGMALGVVEEAKKQGVLLGFNDLEAGTSNRLLIGSSAWNPQVFPAIEAGDIVVSLGGHIWDGGWSIVLIHDYFYRFDFETPMMRTLNVPLTDFNIGEYLQYFADGDWSKIDFTTFSKAYYHELESYDFSLEAVLAHMRAISP